MSDQTILSAANIRKRYGTQEVVAGLDLKLDLKHKHKRGECFGLLDPNGAGKTTTLHMLPGLTAPDSVSSLVVWFCHQ